MEMPIAAEEMGRVSATPITTETISPVTAAATVEREAAQAMKLPSSVSASETGYPTPMPKSAPPARPTRGVTRMSMRVLPETRAASVMAANAPTNAPMGSPAEASEMEKAAPLSIEAWMPLMSACAYEPIMPAATAEATTSGCVFFNFRHTPTPMPAPIAICATLPTASSASPKGLLPALSMRLPICQRMVPAMSVANRPSAMPLIPSIKT